MAILLELILFVILWFAIAGMLFSVFLLVKNEVTFKNHERIIDAIDAFAEENNEYEIGIALMHSMEDYNKTLWRWWDWGCKRILKKEDYELIKPYLEEKNGKKRRID